VNERPAVALESTIFSHLGLPSPHNLEALDRCVSAIEGAGAVPLITAILDGVVRVGIESEDHPRICGPARKVAARDLAVAIGQGWDYGATTVSAALTLAARHGIEVFATGGIGGVHRGWDTTGDISADLGALATHQVITVSAGAKVFLDLAATLERLETDSVAVLGWQTDEFPAFHAVSSGLPLTHRVESAEEVARIARAHWSLGGGGILVAAPVPTEAALDLVELERAVAQALAEADAAGVTGPATTPVVLGALAEATDGRSVPTNLALAENNARIAAAIAVALAEATPATP
jgi:pseudouridine-5'-phosphate glycosidase